MELQYCSRHRKYYRKICLMCKDMPSPVNPVAYLSMMSDDAKKYWLALKKKKYPDYKIEANTV